VLIHRASRTRGDWLRLTGKYALGDGAFAMKHLRCGDLQALGLIAYRLGYLSARGILRFFQRGCWQYEYEYVNGYWKGLWDSWRFPVDRRTRLFQGPASLSQNVSPVSGG
jgi:hypothetical protein